MTKTEAAEKLELQEVKCPMKHGKERSMKCCSRCGEKSPIWKWRVLDLLPGGICPKCLDAEWDARAKHERIHGMKCPLCERRFVVKGKLDSNADWPQSIHFDPHDAKGYGPSLHDDTFNLCANCGHLWTTVNVGDVRDKLKDWRKGEWLREL